MWLASAFSRSNHLKFFIFKNAIVKGSTALKMFGEEVRIRHIYDPLHSLKLWRFIVITNFAERANLDTINNNLLLRLMKIKIIDRSRTYEKYGSKEESDKNAGF